MVVKPSDALLNTEDPNIKEDIMRMILQYLHDEGYDASRLVLHDEANVKWHEQEDLQQEIKRLRKIILEGEWQEIDRLSSKSFLRNQKSFLYACYKQQFMEYVEHHELQKAFTLLTRKLKPLEHFETIPNEFRDLCYLLTSKSINEVASFKNWEGVVPSREKLAEQLQNMMQLDTLSDQGIAHVPPKRLLHLLQQAVAYQVEANRYQPSLAPKITTLLQDYQSFVVPNTCQKTFIGHQGNIKTVAWIEGGEYFISGSSDNTARIWNVESGQCTSILEGHTSRIWSVASTSNGSLAATASGDTSVKVWDLKHHKTTCVSTFDDATGDVYSVRFHPGNLHMASAGYDKIVRFYDIQRETVLKTFSGHSLSISSCIFNPYGNLIITGSKDSTIKFWDISSGLCVKTISSHLGEVTSVEMNYQGSQLLSSSKDNSCRLWDIRMIRPIRRFKGHQNTSKNFIKAGFASPSMIFSGSEDGMVYIWNMQGEHLQKLKGHEGTVYEAAYNPTTSKWISCSDDFTVKLWWYSQPKDE